VEEANVNGDEQAEVFLNQRRELEEKLRCAAAAMPRPRGVEAQALESFNLAQATT